MVSHHLRPLIGWSNAMQDLRAEIRRTAPMDITVMIRGERGTGKELVAREMHLRSNRAGGPFVCVNCASFPDMLIDTELFGCERGAFTGVEFRKGKFEQAHGGTLVLDEIAEMSLTVQPKVLRVLETREVDRMGGKKAIPVDFRLLVSTNRDLRQMARQSKFRDDLYDRLDQDTIRTPPLRERGDDLPVLCEYSIGEYVPEAKRNVTRVSPQVMDLFRNYSWPGNIRELENVIRRGVFKGRSEEIRLEDLPLGFAQHAAPIKLGNHDELLQEYSRQLFMGALKEADGNRTKARKLLGLPRTRFWRLAKKHGLDGEPGDGGSQHDAEMEDADWL